MSQYHMAEYRATLLDEIVKTYTKPEDVIGKHIDDNSKEENLSRIKKLIIGLMSIKILLKS